MRLDDSEDLSNEPTPEHTMSFNAPASDSPEAAAERSETRALLQRAIDSRPAIYRSVFILRAVEEMRVEEAASCLQVSDAVVKTRLLRARSMLRDTLGARVEAHAQHGYELAGARCDAVARHILDELARQGRIRAE